MARRRTPADPELAALARERLARLLGGAVGAPRRAEVGAPVEVAEVDDGWVTGSSGSAARSSVGIEDLEAPRRFTRWHLAVVAVVLLVGLVGGGWSWMRSRPEAVAAVPAVQTAGVPSAAGTASSTSPAASPAAGSPSPSPSVDGPVVHVLGAVAHPGLVRLSPGARVQDAIRAAGGLRRDADPDELNLAQPLEDGVQVVVGTRQHPEGEVRSTGGGSGSGGTGGTGTASSGTGGSGATVDLNAASADQLETLPGVGPVTAQKILDWRQQHGRFTTVAELQEVDGIGPKTYARIAPRARV